MDLKWNGEVGPAAIIGFVGSLSVLVTLGIVYGKMDSKLDTAANNAAEAKTAVTLNQLNTSSQAERLGKVETAVTFIVPTLQRIEARLERPSFNTFGSTAPTIPLPTPRP